MQYNMLFSPMNIGTVTVKNRVVMAPMLLNFATFDGKTTEQLINYYEERAKGGFGLIITEVTRVNDFNGANSFAQLGMSHDYQIEPMRELAERIHKHGTRLFVQLHHPGRQNMALLIGTVRMSITLNKLIPNYSKMLYKVVPAGKVLLKHHLVPRVVSPSKCERSYYSDGVTRELRKWEIKKIITQFVEAAVRVKKSGADGVELHASHGYLIQQFLSPNTNRRTDEYGGTLENRMRFLLEIISGIRKKCGADFPIIVRLTVDEFYETIGQKGKGYQLEEGIRIAKRLEQAGIDAIDVSSAAYDTFNYWLEPSTFECGWRAYLAKAVKEAVSIPVLAANLIRSPEQAEQQLKDGVQDFISLGRPTIADPHWAQKAEAGNVKDIKRCICCLYCIESMEKNAYIGSHAVCAVNPFVGKETEKLAVNGEGKAVVIIGAGPAGLTAAELLAKRGFRTIVLEQADKPGGQVLLANRKLKKEKIYWCIEDLYYAAVKAGAEIKFNTRADKETLSGYAPYAIFVATGGSSVKPKSIPGVDLTHVYTVTEILNGEVDLHGRQVAVIGSGMTGLETAELLAVQGNSVSVVEMAETVAPGTWMQHVDDIMPRLKENNVRFYTGNKLTEIREGSILIEATHRKRVKNSIPCDHVVLSIGVKSENALYHELKPYFNRLYLIGDACKSGRIADAVRSAYEAAILLE